MSNPISTHSMSQVINYLRDEVHENAVASGWHKIDDTVKEVLLLARKPELVTYFEKIREASMVALEHSELSESLEGTRKNLMDDHLKDRPMVEVEIADAIIRLLDRAGKYNYDIGGAIIEKIAYNKQRADHKPEAREGTNGKKF